jgi:hypothetical protein
MIIVGPTSSVAMWWSKVPNYTACSTSASDTAGYYTYICASPPTASFNFNEKSFTIPAQVSIVSLAARFLYE